MTATVCSRVRGVYLFGSSARGDDDECSDTDVLIVYEGTASFDLQQYVHRTVECSLGVRCAFAEYSRSRLNEMFRAGHLFAWHLHCEARALQITGLRTDSSFRFERPQPYSAVMEDAESFRELLISTLDYVSNGTTSVVYEAGMTYVALRNIAMSVSAALMNRPIFTRWSPFELSKGHGFETPCARDEYDRLVAARHASQRGIEAPHLSYSALAGVLESAIAWADNVIGAVRRGPLDTVSELQ